MEATTPSTTRWASIPKDVAALGVRPNLVDYEAECAAFSWDEARRALDGLPGGGVNIAHEAVDRHATGRLADHEALRFVRADGTTRSLTYRELAGEVARFAAVLRRLGVEHGERVYSLLGRMPVLYAAVLGTLKHGAVFCPLFAAFGPEPIRQRMALGDARVLVPTRARDRPTALPGPARRPGCSA